MIELREATFLERILVRIGLRKGFEVEGNSMRPVLRDGDAVLIQKGSTLRVGDVVIARHPFKQSVRIIKRINQIHVPDRYELLGDDPGESTDSRTFGPIERAMILGKVVAKL
jgi:nickel-type superoxide dismutase maturation protease